MKKTSSITLWRSFLFPILVTFSAILFWLSYYGSLRWWPLVLFTVFLGNYVFRIARERGRVP